VPLLKGFNFRSTSGYVTDAADCTYVLAADTYPTSRGGVTFGWTAAPTGHIDRSNAVDARCAGIAYTFGAVTATLRIDLPAPGSYTIRAAFGDQGSAQAAMRLTIKDTSTPKIAIGPVAQAAGEFYDITGTLHTSSANWVANNSSSTQTFDTTIMNVDIGPADSASSTLAHLFISQNEGDWGTIATLGAAANSHSDLTVLSGFTYDYRILASNAAGSTSSNIAVATALSPDAMFPTSRRALHHSRRDVFRRRRI
jgi:hypothetical protein